MIVHILTKNNAKTIAKTLESIQPLNSTIIVGDMGSKDRTVDICENFGAHIIRLDDKDRSSGRNRLIDESPSNELKLMIEPWEVLAQGHQNIQEGYAKVLTGQTINKEIRLWREGRFTNPTYETLQSNTEKETEVLFYSIGSRDHKSDLEIIETWKRNDPCNASPYYYQACCQMTMGEYDKFLTTIEHFLFLKNKSPSSTMARYYVAMVYLIHKKKARPALQNINLCLCDLPLMAEFWCLMADVYYHILKKFNYAKEFYGNALILGKRRLSNDKMPIDVPKYSSYPRKMIDSCNKITEDKSVYCYAKNPDGL